MEFLSHWIVPSSGHAVHPAVYIAVALVALLVVAASKGGFGGGLGIIGVPLMLTLLR